METLTIIQTNDIHSHFENLLNAMSVIQEKKQQLDKENKEYLLIDCGDFCDRVHPFTEVTDGKGNIALLNEFQYDLVTIGNNEGLGNSHEQLNQLYESFNGQALISNLIDAKTRELPQWMTPYKIYQTRSGKKILFFACTALFPMSYQPLGWEVIDPRIVLPKIYERFCNQVDGFVLISHLGKHLDDELAEQFQWLNVILGSHTHHLYPQGKQVGQTMITGSQKWGHFVTQLTLNLDDWTSKVATYDIQDIHLEVAREREEQLLQRGQVILSQQVVGELERSLSVTESCQAVVEALQQKYQADGCFLNTGLFLTPLYEGLVTAFDLQQCLPHPMHVMEVMLSGDDMKRFLYEISKNRHYLQKFHLVGMGFRGKKVGDILSSGFTEENGEWLFQGQAIETDRLYHIVTVDHYYFVPYFPTISYAGRIHLHMERFLRWEVADLINQL